mgnify:CR=1 FL=1
MVRLTESVVEDAALAWLKLLGSYAVLAGPGIAPVIVPCGTLHPKPISGEFAERVIAEAI